MKINYINITPFLGYIIFLKGECSHTHTRILSIRINNGNPASLTGLSKDVIIMNGGWQL